MTEYAGLGPIEEGLPEDTSPLASGTEAPEEASIKELLSETSLPGSDVLGPPKPPRKKRSLGIG